MKTVAQWAEQLPELVKIEFLKVNSKRLQVKFKYIYVALRTTSWIDKKAKNNFWCGVYENALIDPTSADYIDETIPYTKEEVEAMILEFADHNDELCKVMLANVGMTFEKGEDIGNKVETLMRIAQELEQENEALKSQIADLQKEFYPLHRELNSANALIKSYRIDNGNKVNEIEQLTRELKATQEAFTKKTKTETNHKPSLSQRFLNWILS